MKFFLTGTNGGQSSENSTTSYNPYPDYSLGKGYRM